MQDPKMKDLEYDEAFKKHNESKSLVKAHCNL